MVLRGESHLVYQILIESKKVYMDGLKEKVRGSVKQRENFVFSCLHDMQTILSPCIHKTLGPHSSLYLYFFGCCAYDLQTQKSKYIDNAAQCESSLNVPLYLTLPGSGCGPWILLLATSNGMLQHEARVPAVNPIKNFLANSALQ